MEDLPRDEAAYLRAVVDASALAAELLIEMERVAEQLAPERSAALAAAIDARFSSPLAAARATLAATSVPAALADFGRVFIRAFEHAVECASLFAGYPRTPAPEHIPRILAALHHHARAQEHFYALHDALPPFQHYWSAPPPARPPAAAPPAHPPVQHVSAGGHHGGFALYVPETYDERRPWPLIVALHGGSGNGDDFLWTWVRDAKSRGYLLVAPSAVGHTWGDDDEYGLLEILAWLGQRYRVAPERVLLTGLSDGATFALLYGLAHPEAFRALAPCCGVFHPANFANGNLTRARAMPIYLVHGARDFLFPVTYAHMTRDVLQAAGADLTYRELPELSHTYPRSENAAILGWFEGKTAAAAAPPA
jgi:phospholipase/carboxylesterase